MTDMQKAIIAAAHRALNAHCKAYEGQILKDGTFASQEFDRLYDIWIAARWDAGDPWVRSVWIERPIISLVPIVLA